MESNSPSKHVTSKLLPKEKSSKSSRTSDHWSEANGQQDQGLQAPDEFRPKRSTIIASKNRKTKGKKNERLLINNDNETKNLQQLEMLEEDFDEQGRPANSRPVQVEFLFSMKQDIDSLLDLVAQVKAIHKKKLFQQRFLDFSKS
jgi:hypothetical protein